MREDMPTKTQPHEKFTLLSYTHDAPFTSGKPGGSVLRPQCVWLELGDTHTLHALFTARPTDSEVKKILHNTTCLAGVVKPLIFITQEPGAGAEAMLTMSLEEDASASEVYHKLVALLQPQFYACAATYKELKNGEGAISALAVVFSLSVIFSKNKMRNIVQQMADWPGLQNIQWHGRSKVSVTLCAKSVENPREAIEKTANAMGLFVYELHYWHASPSC